MGAERGAVQRGSLVNVAIRRSQRSVIYHHAHTDRQTDRQTHAHTRSRAHTHTHTHTQDELLLLAGGEAVAVLDFETGASLFAPGL